MNRYACEVRVLAASDTAREETFYPAIRSLYSDVLGFLGFPMDVRTVTSEDRVGGGADIPDLAIYEKSGEFMVVCGEVKLPDISIEQLARSTDRNDQIGRYLAQTRAVLLSNVRAFGLLTADPAFKGRGPVPPNQRRLEQVVTLWPEVSSIDPNVLDESVSALAELLETAITRFAPIAEPSSLARILARQARRAKADLPEAFGKAVKGLLDDYGKALGLSFDIDGEGGEFFRSSLVQTIYYSLFAAWTLWVREGQEGRFRADDLSSRLSIPFLGELFHEIRHPSRISDLGLARHLDLATETLRRVHVESFLERLGDVRDTEDQLQDSARMDAILYFYEPFLESFDPELRKQLGVWYTPPEIVRYQVRRVEEILKTELDCERGFADERVVVLDPCCGTGAYLLGVVDCVIEQLRREGAGAELGEKVSEAVQKRIVGFEILTAPFVVAHLQLNLLLGRLGVKPHRDRRAAIYLTNALTGWSGVEQLRLHFPELQEEHDAARNVKRDAKIIVMIGNPPYNRFAGAAAAEEATLVDHYKGIERDSRGKQRGKSLLFTRWGVRKHLLDDLYIRFFRLAEERIGKRADYGVVSFVSNNSYLAGRSHPIMRESLLHSFQKIWIDNLHGNRLASERTPWGDTCETVFSMPGGPGIKVGVAISTLLKKLRANGDQGVATVMVRDFWGRAEDKRSALLQALRP